MIYALILTTYMTGKYNDTPTVAQTVTPGFTQEACKDAGDRAKIDAPSKLGRHENYALVTYQCAPMGGK